jgi:hypothetical protein
MSADPQQPSGDVQLLPTAQPPVPTAQLADPTTLPTPPASNNDTVPVASPVTTTQSDSTSLLTDDEKLDLFDQAISYAQSDASVLDQVLPSTFLANDPLNPVQTSGVRAGQPEVVRSSVAPVEAGTQAQVEYEPNAELPVEVEGFLQRVDSHADKLPQEIVLADGDLKTVPQAHPTTPVIVLPIDEDDEQAAKGKSPSWSIVWLVEWSHKMIKKFVGTVIYRQPPTVHT